jgi:hypothetical protein
VPAGASAYRAVSPSRLADTRPEAGGLGFTRLSPNTIRVAVAGRGGVPSDASAAVLNIASVNAVGAGFVTAYPAGSTLPLAASLNVDEPSRTIANLATVQLGADGSVDIYSNVPMDLVVDVQGAYSPVAGAVSAGRLVTISGGARRVLDTRDDATTLAPGGIHVVDLTAAGVPADATAVVVNLAAVSAAPGYWTAFPHGDPVPLASSLNIDELGQTRNSQGIVRLLPGPRAFDVFSLGGGDLVVDVVGWFTGSSSPSSTDGLFVSTSPIRRLDTRTQSLLAPWGGSTIEFDPGSTLGVPIAAVAMNIAIAEPLYVGFVTAFPAGQPRPLAANLNITSFDQIISNHATVRVGQRGVALFTQSGTHMIVDVTGWYLGQPDGSPESAPVNPAYGPTPAVAVSSAEAGFDVAIGRGANINAVVDRGVAGLWAGNGVLGAPDHNVFFAHRTSHGGPFRNIDRMPVGSTFVVTGADGIHYRYMVMRVDVILPIPTVLFNLVQTAGAVTATVVACHPPHKITYRLAVTGRLIGASPL